jgi:hypothetical protein
VRGLYLVHFRVLSYNTSDSEVWRCDRVTIELPDDLKCIPSEDLREYIDGDYDDCQWSDVRCDPDPEPTVRRLLTEEETDLSRCCVWAGSYAGNALRPPCATCPSSLPLSPALGLMVVNTNLIDRVCIHHTITCAGTQ